MAFDPKTFNLRARKRYVDAWMQVERLMDKTEEPVYWPLGEYDNAVKERNNFNLVRAAIREQGWAGDPFRYDHIKVTVRGAGRDGELRLQFTEQEIDLQGDFRLLVGDPG
jgi:hypothetical protein